MWRAFVCQMEEPRINLDTSLSCATCGKYFPGAPSPLFKCPDAATETSADHVLMPSKLSATDLGFLAKSATESVHASPFIKYRSLLYPYRVAMNGGMR